MKHNHLVLPRRIRIDCGTETDDMAAIHFLLRKEVDVSVTRDQCIRHGTSTLNKIERFWREPHARFEGFFKDELNQLLEEGHYDPSSQLDRCLLLLF